MERWGFLTLFESYITIGHVHIVITSCEGSINAKYDEDFATIPKVNVVTET